MILSTQMWLGDEKLIYQHRPGAGEHSCYIGVPDGPVKYAIGSAGDVVNFLAPYRGRGRVDELFAWLCR